MSLKKSKASARPAATRKSQAWASASPADRPRLAKEALVARVDGKVADLMSKLDRDAKVEFLTFEDEAGKKAHRHSTSHVMAQAVLEYATAKAPRRSVSSTTYTAQTDSVAFQLRLAEAAIKIDSALMHAHRAAADVQSAAEAGGLPEPLIRARVRMDSGWVSTLCREAIDDLMTAHGSSGFADFSPIARIWRDQETSSRHAILQTDVCKEVYGKALLGVEPNVSHLI